MKNFKRSLKGSLPLIFVLLIAAILLTQFNLLDDSKAMLSSDTKLRIHFIDVGQGDSILIQFPDGETSLIDGGSRGYEDSVLQYLKRQGIKRIDYLIATHPHEDHIGGLPKLIQNLEISSVYMPKVSANTRIFEKLLAEIKDKGLKVTAAKAGMTIKDTGGVIYKVLAPNAVSYEEINEYSVVIKLTYLNKSFLFTGDAEKVSEDEMIDGKENLSADVLKIGHHGGKTSTSKKFLERVNPQYAVISVGKQNDYGHPHEEILGRLRDRNIKVFRTDEAGTVLIQSDGHVIQVNK